jgi:uncharacterized membrane protein
MAATTVSSETTTVKPMSQIKNMGILLAGAIILAVHIMLLLWSQNIFNIFVCVYVLAFSIFITVVLYKNQSCFIKSKNIYNILTYVSLYTILLEAVLLAATIFLTFYKSKASTKPSYSYR